MLPVQEGGVSAEGKKPERGRCAPGPAGFLEWPLLVLWGLGAGET